MVDANGFPTNPAYLEAQGLTLQDLNRAYVEQQQQQQQLLEVLSDPQQRDVFLQEYNRLMQGTPQEQQQQSQRPEFPGGAPGQTPQAQPDLSQYYQYIKQTAAIGNPLDNLDGVQQMWSQIPNEAWRGLAYDLIQGDF